MAAITAIGEVPALSPVGEAEGRSTGGESRAVGGRETHPCVGWYEHTVLCRGQVINNKIKQIPTLSLAFQPPKMYSVKAPLTTGNITGYEPYMGNLCAISDEILYVKVLQKTLNKMLLFFPPFYEDCG